MKISEIYAARRFCLSFELFPPKSDAGLDALYTHLDALVKHRPSFITCTYGAGGSTRDKTLEIVTSVLRRYGVPVASHLTCVGATADELRSYLQQAAERKIDNIVALRGDPPQGEARFQPVAGGLCHANELVAMIRAEFPKFGIAVAGYPEKHVEAPDLDTDLRHLKRKVDSGADAVITQLFYDNRDFYRFRDRCDQVGVKVPIIPGILPVTNLSQIQRITSLCGAKLPEQFVARLGQHADETWQFESGVEFAIRQVQELIDRGIPGVHFYVLNKSQATCRLLDSVALPGQPT
jgi:methylenetetrahydrofolate reductase (NADPH)